MRITLRLIVSLVIVVASVAFFSSYLQVRQEEVRHLDELERRSRLLAESLQEAVEPHLAKGSFQVLGRLAEKFGGRERLAGVAIYDDKGAPLAVTKSIMSALPALPKAAAESLEKGIDVGEFDMIGQKEMHLYALPLRAGEKITGALVLFHDAAYIQAQLSRIWRRTFLRVFVQAVFISVIILLTIRWSVAGPIAQMADWMKRLRAGEAEDFFRFRKSIFLLPSQRR